MVTLSKEEFIEIGVRNNENLFYLKLEEAEKSGFLNDFINQKYEKRSFLWYMIKEKRFKMALDLLEKEAKLNYYPGIGNEIHILMDRINIDNLKYARKVFSKLLEAGVDLNQINKYNNSAFAVICSWVIRGKYYPEKKDMLTEALYYKPDIDNFEWGSKPLRYLMIEDLGYNNEEINKIINN